MDNLLDKHGSKFRCKIQGEITEGRIFVEEDYKVFLLQNEHDGVEPEDSDWKKWGYRYSWIVGRGYDYELDRNEVTELSILSINEPLINEAPKTNKKDKKKLLLLYL